MTPADVLLRLVTAGVVLWVEGDRLRYRAPAGALDEALRGDVTRCRRAIMALIRAGAVECATQAEWSPDNLEKYEERAAMMEHLGGLPRAVAEREAERLVRVAHTRAFLERAAMLGSAAADARHPDVDDPAAAVAPRREGAGPRRRP